MRELLRRCWYVLRHRQMAADLNEELEFHRALKERELEGRGLTPAEARDGARRAVGNELVARERAADVWVSPWLQDVAHDLRFAGRVLLKDRGFTLVAVVALGLGIGVNNTLFSMLNAFCIRGLPIESPDRVVYVASRDAAGRDRALSYLDFQDLRSASGSVGEFAAFAAAPVALRDPHFAADRFQGAYISASAFRMIGEAPVLGRDFRQEDDAAGAPLVAIIGGGAWSSRYGRHPSVVGRSVVVNGTPATIIGVMREGFAFPNNAEVWLPLSQMRGLAGQTRAIRTLGAFGRLADGTTLTAARAEIDAIGRRLEAQHPATNENVRLTTIPINERFMGRLTDPAWLAFITTGALVMIIACANVANLLLARSAVRAREIAIRASLGASRRRVVRQLLVESSLLAACGAVCGFALSLVGLIVILRAIPAAARPYWLDFSMDGLVFAVLAAVCISTVFLSGLVPALHVSRTNPSEVMREGRGTTGGLRARRWTAAFLTAEFALTMILLSVVGEAVVGFFERQRVDSLIDPAPLLTMSLSLPAEKYPMPPQRIAFYDSLLQRLRGITAVSGVAAATSLPAAATPARDVVIEGRAPAAERTPITARTVIVSDHYFQVLGLPIVSGRSFTTRDGSPGQETAVVNQRFAAVHFGNGDPIGHRIRLTTGPAAANTPWITIVGVSPTVRQRPQLDPEPVVYLPYRAEPPPTVALIVRVPEDPATVTSRIREALRGLDADLPLYRILSLEQAMAESGWNARLATWIITILALICVCLSVVGLYAVTAHSVAQRTQELGVRTALGARPREISWLVLRRALWQIAIGVAAGILGTYLWGRLFGSGLFVGPLGLLAVTILLGMVALTACLVPARRAARLDPVAALRAD